MYTISLDPKAQSPSHPQARKPFDLPPLPGRIPAAALGGRDALADSGLYPGMQMPAKATGSEAAAEAQAMAELDAMLIQDPPLGAARGLRVALLFNAALALSGLMAYEIWSMLAQ